MTFNKEYLDKVVIDLMGRKIELYGSDGTIKAITKNSVDQFMEMVGVARKNVPEERIEYSQIR